MSILCFWKYCSPRDLKSVAPECLTVILLLLQLLIGGAIVSVNNILRYDRLLMTSEIAKTARQQVIQSKILKSTSTWIIIYITRFMNSLGQTDVVFLAMLLDKASEYAKVFKYSGFVVIGFVALATHIHYNESLEEILSA